MKFVPFKVKSEKRVKDTGVQVSVEKITQSVECLIIGRSGVDRGTQMYEAEPKENYFSGTMHAIKKPTAQPKLSKKEKSMRAAAKGSRPITSFFKPKEKK